MKQLSSEFKVGLFTLVGMLATVVSIFVLSPELLDRQERSRYYTILEDASGILEKTHVRTNGVTVGRVISVNLHQRATMVKFEIRADIPIPEGSKILVRTVGFLGDKYLEISRDVDSGRVIAPGGYVVQAKDSGDVNEVIAVLGSIGQDIKKVTENLARVLGSESGYESLTRIVENIEKVTEDTRGILEENRSELRILVSNLREVSESLNGVMNEDNRQRLERIIANFDASMEEVNVASKNIKLIAEKVERGEGTIGRLINDDETLGELEATIKEIRTALAPVNRLELGVESRVEARRDGANQAYVDIRFQWRPDVYYLLGLTDVNEQQREVTFETLEQNQQEGFARTRETIQETQDLRFNVQAAKRWGPLVARFGLFESSGGLATDLFAFQDRFKLSVEVYDFATSEFRRFARIKTYASLLFFNHIEVLIGVDDWTRLAADGDYEPRINTFLGAGLSFTDEDLKSLFGVAAIAAGS